MTDRDLRWKLTFHAHTRTLVLVKHAGEKIEHRLMMALHWALYLPEYPGLRIDVRIGARYRPDLMHILLQAPMQHVSTCYGKEHTLCCNASGRQPIERSTDHFI